MKALHFLLLLSALPAILFSASDYKSPLSSLGALLNSTGVQQLPSMLGVNINNLSPADIGKIAGALNGTGGITPSAVAGAAGIGATGVAGSAAAAGIPIPQPPAIVIPAGQLYALAALALVFLYVFAAGKIADFLQSSGRKITKREALYAPFAMMFVALVFISFYFLSGMARPPQDTLVTILVYTIVAPAAIAIGIGALVLKGFFADRLSAVQSLDLSLHIVLAPIFDGLKGYWTALGAAAILALISSVAFYSSGGRFALATFDFLLLSILASLYYLYRAFTTPGNENKASNAVVVMCLLAPNLLQRQLKEVACAALSQIPLPFLHPCPLESAGAEVTLALTIGTVMLLLVPVVPIVYAFAINLLRAYSLAKLLLSRGEKGAVGEGKEEGDSQKGEENTEDDGSALLRSETGREGRGRRR